MLHVAMDLLQIMVDMDLELVVLDGVPVMLIAREVEKMDLMEAVVLEEILLMELLVDYMVVMLIRLVN